MSSDAQRVMLAQSWSEDDDPTGYWMAEKLDGVRAYFDGKDFYSRAGNKFTVPDWFSEHLPKDQPLDGELWLGRGQFQNCISIVKNQKAQRADEWKEITYLVFDAPKLNLVYEKRLEHLRTIMPLYGKDSLDTSSLNTKIPPFARLVPVQRCHSKAHLLKELENVQNLGGEGIMLRSPRSRYEFKRSKTLLKVKSFFDEEAIVVSHNRGTGKHSHRMGCLNVKTPDGRTFSVGTGFTDAQREKPPKIGSVITYKFQELSTRLTPRFPSFVGERIDIRWDDYCKTYKPPTLTQATSAKVVTLLKQKSLIFSGGASSNVGSPAAIDVDDDDDDNDSVYTPTSPASPSSSSSSSADRGASPVSGNKRKLASAYTNSASTTTGTPSLPSPAATNTSTSSTTATSAKNSGDSDDDDDGKQELCMYGAQCYRRNPDHLRKYKHPHKKARV
ncbi:hypothetical protein DFQ26_007311 [Actinomortierella ambigua]|nr:hypothetical protein DFQ26_007311 [Actinomortierella ambigua]